MPVRGTDGGGEDAVEADTCTQLQGAADDSKDESGSTNCPPMNCNADKKTDKCGGNFNPDAQIVHRPSLKGEVDRRDTFDKESRDERRSKNRSEEAANPPCTKNEVDRRGPIALLNDMIDKESRDERRSKNKNEESASRSCTKDEAHRRGPLALLSVILDKENRDEGRSNNTSRGSQVEDRPSTKDEDEDEIAKDEVGVVPVDAYHTELREGSGQKESQEKKESESAESASSEKASFAEGTAGNKETGDKSSGDEERQEKNEAGSTASTSSQKEADGKDTAVKKTVNNSKALEKETDDNISSLEPKSQLENTSKEERAVEEDNSPDKENDAKSSRNESQEPKGGNGILIVTDNTSLVNGAKDSSREPKKRSMNKHVGKTTVENEVAFVSSSNKRKLQDQSAESLVKRRFESVKQQPTDQPHLHQHHFLMNPHVMDPQMANLHNQQMMYWGQQMPPPQNFMHGFIPPNVLADAAAQQQMMMMMGQRTPEMPFPKGRCHRVILTLPPPDTKLGILLDDNITFGLPELKSVATNSPIRPQIPEDFQSKCW